MEDADLRPERAGLQTRKRDAHARDPLLPESMTIEKERESAGEGNAW